MEIEKSARELAKDLNLSIARIYQLKRKKQLESRVNGTWTPADRSSRAKKYFGKSVNQWAKEFDVNPNKIRYLIKIKKLGNAIKTKNPNIRKSVGRLVKGKNLSYWAKMLGITRERARQLANKNLLTKRIKETK